MYPAQEMDHVRKTTVDNLLIKVRKSKIESTVEEVLRKGLTGSDPVNREETRVRRLRTILV